MAPTITSTEYPKEHLSLTHKIRKPIVEKMRRDRINNSIEELKALLGPQLLNQQPDSKLEKADILEMTVCLLRRKLQQHKTLKSSNEVDQGFSNCAQEVISYLSKDEVQTKSHGKVLNHVQILKPSSDEEKPLLSMLNQHTLCKEKISTKSAIWRPW